MHKLALTSSYDDIADVLYITVSDGQPRRYREDGDGLVWRLDGKGHELGVTVQDYVHLWGDRRRQLSLRVAEALHVPRADVVKALPVDQDVLR